MIYALPQTVRNDIIYGKILTESIILNSKEKERRKRKLIV